MLQLHLRILRCEEHIFDNDKIEQISLQDLDFIAQSLGALAQFLGEVAADLEIDPIIDINKPLQRVVLETIASVLSSEAPTKEDLARLSGLTDSKGVDLF